MTTNIEKEIKKLESRTKKIKTLLQYASRAFVMEFSGTPKSGKTTSVEAIRQFLSRHGFRVHVLTERAAVCPIPMKGHLFFNTWCATSMLAELLANVESQTDIIIVDRGLFDALVWLTLQKKRGEVTSKEAATIDSFLLLDRWRTLIDIPVVLNVSVKDAIDREKALHITSKGGSIMNKQVLTAIVESVDEAISRYSSKFNGVIRHITTGKQVRKSNIDLANKIFDRFESFLNPDILVVTRREIEELPLEQGGLYGKTAVQKVHECIKSHCCFMPRHDAENNIDYVQIIPSAILRYEDEIFVFERKETDPKYHLFGKHTVWKGCHVSKREGIPIPKMMKQALLDRISRELFLSRVFPIKALGYCWDADDQMSSKHLGIIYQIEIDNLYTALDLKKKEFRKMRGHGFTGMFIDYQDIWKHDTEIALESWSLTIKNWINKL
jgi:predicted NUDIX family phosphoesterase